MKVRGDAIWIEAGLQRLTEHGRQALTVDGLCRDTGKTKGSFYHHFSGITDFVHRLLLAWQKAHTQDLIDLTEGLAPEQALSRLQALAGNLPFERENAFRSWARHDPDVAGVVTQVDQMRAGYLQRLYQAGGQSPQQAEGRAWLEYATFLGLAQLRGSISKEQIGAVRQQLELGAERHEAERKASP